ncbi:MAG TPA: amino acid permease [Gemmatimonas aurantiaca]|uniref:Arginine/agmatine antiporter n=2 Tax=Gemmatimonas aurantiaca TaxID=173480 RepID=C1A775_GEMAT|nr:APC family permease [Gemmatimonas aurantiaca]BAH38085.1 amino acid permease [Gemmatimonas aurantiaca T-27]HCT56859.1 amino acid permease [Gemmatimonas aurantiaca]
MSPRGRELVRAVGVWGLAASIFNVTVGGGIFRLPASAAAAAGPAAPFVYLICAAVMGCVVLCFAEAGSRITLTGGPYAYVEAVFGRYVGFLAGVLLWMLGTTAVAGVSSAFAEGLGALFGVDGLRVPIIVAMFLLLAAINMRGVEQGTKLIMVASVAKLLPLIAFVAIGVFFIQPDNIAVRELPSASSMARAAIVLVFAFSGVETALVPSGEVKDPARTVPRALAIAMIGVTLLYLAVHLVAAGLLGDRLATSTAAPLAFAAESFLGTPGRLLLLIGASISMFGYVSGMTLAVPRALYRFAEDGLLPKVVGSIHPTWRTPHVAILLQTTLVASLAVFNSFEALAVISNLAALLLYAGCAAATIMLRRRGIRQEGAVPFAVPGGPIIPFITIALIAWLLTSITQAEWVVLLVTLGVATGFFVVATRTRRA